MSSNEPPKITFEEDQWRSPVRSVRSETPKAIQWVIKYSGGLVKDKRQAKYVLLGFVLVAIVISLILLFGGGPQGQELQRQFPPGSPALPAL